MTARVIISGGGTGGHIYPALTIAQTIQERYGAEFLFVGSDNGLEMDIVPAAGYQLTTLPVRGFARTLTWKHLVTFALAAKSVVKADALIRQWRPDVIVGTGGYVCGPMLLAGVLRGVPTLIQEQNVVPGITNRMLGRFVTKIALGYKEACSYFPSSEKCIVTGNPIREDVMCIKRKEARERLHIPDGDFVILAAGGSRGARTINDAMRTVFAKYAEETGITILHVSGTSEYERNCSQLESAGLLRYPHLRLIPYMEDMPTALAATDLAIYRAGAVGLAELTCRGVPSILIPYPYATANHQLYNANVLRDAGAACVIENHELTGDLLVMQIEKLRRSPKKMREMAEASRHLGNPDAARTIAELAFSLIR